MRRTITERFFDWVFGPMPEQKPKPRQIIEVGDIVEYGINGFFKHRPMQVLEVNQDDNGNTYYKLRWNFDGCTGETYADDTVRKVQGTAKGVE